MSLQRRYLSKAAVFMAGAMLIAYLGTLYVAYGFPIYPDEIAERLALSRIGYDFPYKIDLTPMCKLTHLHYPIFWYLPAWIEWWVHGHIQTLINLRIHGLIGSGLLIILLMYKLNQKPIKNRATFYKNPKFLIIELGFILALLEMGVMPFFLVTLRPEQTILYCLLALSVLYSQTLKTSHARIIALILYFISIAILFYQHPKTIFLTPIVLLVGWRVFSSFKKNIFWCLWIFLMVFVFTSFQIWIQMMDCSASPNVAAIYSGSTVNLHNIVHHPTLFFSELGHSILNFKRELTHLRFLANSEIGYLPSVTLTWPVRVFNIVIFVNYLVLMCGILFFSIRSYYQDLQQKKFLTPHLLVLSILFCAFLNFSLNLCKHWYDAGYLWALLVFATVAYIAEHMAWIIKQKTTYVILIYVLLVGIVSQIILVTHYWQPFQNGFEGVSISLHKYNSQRTERVLKKLSLLCRINRRKSHYLILDDATYLYFQESSCPLAITYLWMGNDQKFLEEFGNSYPSDGMIVRARYLSDSLQKKYAIKIDDFICVPKSHLKPLLRDWLVERMLP